MFEDRPLLDIEKRKMPSYEREVIDFYEGVTGNTFHRFEVISLKKCIRSATPEQIKAIIMKMKKVNNGNFKDFHYIVQPVKNMFGSKPRGGKTHGKNQ